MSLLPSPLDSIGKYVTLLFFITNNCGTFNGGKNASLLIPLVKLVLLAVNKPIRFTLARQSIVVSDGTSQVKDDDDDDNLLLLLTWYYSACALVR